MKIRTSLPLPGRARRIMTVAAAIFVTAVTPAAALDVTLTAASTLSEQIADPTSVTELNVTGPVDAADMYYIGRTLTELRTLDLSKAEIVAYAGDRLEGRTTYKAGHVPPMAFSGLPLTTVKLPAHGELSIGDGAFAGTRLTEVAIPDNVDSVGMGAYSSIPTLKEVTLSLCKLGHGAFADNKALERVNTGYATKLPPSAFRRCTSLTTVENSNRLQEIGALAFEGCTSLTTFGFGTDLTYIGAGAFASTGLEGELDLSRLRMLSTIGDGAFAENKGLTSVELPINLENTGNATFLGDTSLKDITIPGCVIDIGSHALAGTIPEELALPESLETIGAYALSGLDGITSLTLPSTLISIGSGAMSNMTGLIKINAVGLSDVPELGDAVWAGVKQDSVVLEVGRGMTPQFADADQWREFKIVDVSGVDDITTDSGNRPKVEGRFEGTDLRVRATGAEIAVIRVYSTSGALLAMATPYDSEATIDTAGMPGGVYVATVELTDGTHATIKAGRR